MLDIPDVPLPTGSGGEKDQVLAFQEEDTVLWILLYYPKKSLRQLVFILRHILNPHNAFFESSVMSRKFFA
jgi:hypothetical protein